MLSNILSYAVQVSVVLAVGLLTPRLLRLRSPAVSMRYWQLLLLAVLALPLVQPWRAPTPGTVTVEAVGLAMSQSVAEAIPSRLPLPAGSWVLVVLGLVAVVRLLWLAFGLRALRRLRAGARPDHRLSGAVDVLEAQLGTEASVLLSPQVRLPITFGWRRPTVLLPERVARLPKSQQVGVLCHELLHVRRRDWGSVLLEQAIRAVLWFHPAVWVLLGRIALSREQVIDADVVRITGARRPYLDALWTMARSVDHSAPQPALTLLNRSDLFHRVALLAEEVKMSKYRVAATAVVVVACVAVAGAAVATTFPLVKSAAAVSMAAGPGGESTSEKSADKDPYPDAVRFVPDGDVTKPEIIHKVSPTYPEEARRSGLMGVVVCEAIITAEGDVAAIKIVRTADELFNQPTVDAIKQWKFDPATLHGEPVDVIYILTVKYNLEKGPKEETEKSEE
jgi:TonB family protein